jgi:hypothetical protein
LKSLLKYEIFHKIALMLLLFRSIKKNTVDSIEKKEDYHLAFHCIDFWKFENAEGRYLSSNFLTEPGDESDIRQRVFDTHSDVALSKSAKISSLHTPNTLSACQP